MPYPYLGIAPRMYPQYIDTGTDAPLQPEPGGSYDMTPAAGHEGVPVPPQDGLWGLPAKTSKDVKAAAAASEGDQG